MDLSKLIAELRARQASIDRTIAELEAVQHLFVPPGKRRGRKQMDVAERERVASRMKQYWAQKRNECSESQSDAAAPVSSARASVTSNLKTADFHLARPES
jgi:hypothetical protein